MSRRQQLVKLLEICNLETSAAQVHCQSLKAGLINDSFVVTKLNVLYSRNASITLARKLFDETSNKTVYLRNAMLRSYNRAKRWQESLFLFRDMISGGNATDEKHDSFTVSIALKACSVLRAHHIGKVMHGFAKKQKLDADMFVGSALIELYSKCGEISEACKVFMEYTEPDVVLWTSMVTGYENNSHPEKALTFLSMMVMGENMSPDPVTLVSAVSACAQLADYKLGSSVHGYVLRRGFENDISLANAFLNFYGKTSSIKNAANVFKGMSTKDVVSWSSMIACYSHNGAGNEAIALFNEMLNEKIEANSVTVISTLQACASSCNLDEGKRIHKYAIDHNYESQTSVSTALIDMYMKCSSPENAEDVFSRMPQKDVVSFVALLSGYAQNGMADKSITVFRYMLSNGIPADAVAIVKVLGAASELGNLQQAVCLHGYVIKSGFDSNNFISATLIELYAKCSSIDDAAKLFTGMPDKDVVIWSSMIAGYGIHGQGEEALKLFYQMIEHSPVRPNNVTFLSILTACSRGGMVREGLEVFKMMLCDCQLKPDLEHYAILVDLLGRTGELDKAMDIIKYMPVPVGPHVWGALLGASRMHQNVKVGEIAATNLFQLDKNHAGYYILMSNIYALGKDWENVEKLRTSVKEKKIKKIVAHSAVEVTSTDVNSFVPGDEIQSDIQSAEHIRYANQETKLSQTTRLNGTFQMRCTENNCW